MGIEHDIIEDVYDIIMGNDCFNPRKRFKTIVSKLDGELDKRAGVIRLYKAGDDTTCTPEYTITIKKGEE